MSLEIYKADLSNRHELTHAISIQMSEFYNDIGKCSIMLPIDEYNINAVEKNGILYDTDRDMSFIIQQVKYDTVRNYIVANGYTCNWLLNKRCVASRTSFTNVEAGIYAAVTDNLRSLSPVFVSSTQGFTEETDTSWYGEQLLDAIIKLLDVHELGHRMRWDPENSRHVFEIYKGEDKTSGIHAVIFSEEQGTAENLVIDNDDSTFKNFFYAVGKLKRKDSNGDPIEILVTSGTATGNDRRECWLSSEANQEEDESEADFGTRVVGLCLEEAAKRIQIQNFTVDINPADYRTAFNLGDIVACVSKRFGVQFTARITGVTYKLDATGTVTTLTLGEPTLTVLGEANLLGRY